MVYVPPAVLLAVVHHGLKPQVRRKLFLLDACGAALTAFFLFFVLRPFYGYFGMPTHVLAILAVIALGFLVFSGVCFLRLKKNWTPFLRAISFGNASYCVLTAVLMFVCFDRLTSLGVAYFTAEIALIVVLVYIELRVAAALSQQLPETEEAG